MPTPRPKFPFPQPDTNFSVEELTITIPQPDDFMYLQKLNDRDGDDKFLGWLMKPGVLAAIEKKNMIVAKNSKGEIVGFLLGNRRRDGFGRVNSICVCKEFRRFGIGKILMNHFLTMNTQGLLLKVMHLNSKAVEFFHNKLKGKPISVEINKKDNVLIEYFFESIPD